jgi:hypothetical protein
LRRDRKGHASRLTGWAGFLSDQGVPTIWLRIRHTAELTETIVKQPAPRPEADIYHRKILYVEAWHRGQLPWRSVDEVYAVRRREAEYEFRPLGTSDAVAQAEKIKVTWDEENRLALERFQDRRYQPLTHPSAGGNSTGFISLLQFHRPGMIRDLVRQRLRVHDAPDRVTLLAD